MVKKELGIGIAGMRMGLSHALGMEGLKGCKLVGICDIREDILDNARIKTAIGSEKTYLDFDEMLKGDDLDVVIVATPDQIHREQTVKALEAGKHVLCEKPMALSLDECRAMIGASDRTGKKLMIGQIGRYSPGFIKAKQLIDRGEIGELFFIESEYAHDYTNIPGIGNWRIDPVRLRHPMLGGGCHAVDLLRWIGGDPVKVNAFANRKVFKNWPVDDCTIGIMEFPDNVIGKVFTSVGCKRKYTMRSVFYGTEGTIICDNTSNYITLFKERLSNGEKILEDIPDQNIGIEIPVSINNHNTTGELAEFIDIIQNDREVKTDGREGAKTVSVCLALVESGASGGETRIPSYDF